MKIKKKIVIPIVILVVLGIVAAIAVPRILEVVSREAPQMEAPVSVSADTPGIGEIARETQITGTIQPGELVYAIPKTSGEVTHTYFEPGDTVRAGQVLCTLSDDAVRPQVEQAQAGVSIAQANVNMVRGGATEQQVVQLQAQVESAKSQFEEAELGLARTKELFEAGAASQQNLEQAQRGYDMAKLQYESAQKAYELTTEKVIGENLATAQAQLKQAQAGLNAAQKQLAYTRVTAPISGVIERKMVSAHDMASPQNPVYVIASRNEMTVNFSVSEDNMKHMKVGDKLTVEKGGKTYSGQVLEISTMVDQQTGLFLIKGSVEEAGDLFTGTTVKVTATTERVENVMVLPLDTVYYDSGKPYVYLVEDGVAKKTFIETGLYDNEQIQVTGGLTAESYLVTTWSSQLKDGSKINVQPDTKEPAQESSAAASAAASSEGGA